MCLLLRCLQKIWFLFSNSRAPFTVYCSFEYRLHGRNLHVCVFVYGLRWQFPCHFLVVVTFRKLHALCICLFSTESSEEGFPHTPTSLHPSPDSSDRVSVSSQPDSSHPLDYLFLSQCETGSVSTSRYVQSAILWHKTKWWQQFMFNKYNAFPPIYVDMTAFQTLRSLWSRSHQTMLSGTLSPHLFTPIPLPPPSFMPAPVHLFSSMGGWLTLLSALHAPPWRYRRPLPLHNATVPQMSSSLTNLIRLHRLRQRVTDKHLLRCHPSLISCQSSWVMIWLAGQGQTMLHYVSGGPLCQAWTILEQVCPH